MARQIPLKIKNVEKKEKKGSYGAWRRQFCEQYGALLVRVRKNALDSLSGTLEPKGERITCREGCTACCFHYVTVSLAHGIVIADHLYKRKDLLGQFLANYEKWHSRGYSISSSIDNERISSSPMGAALEKTRPLSSRYLEMGIQCPFLVNDRCSIYEVRPLSCSGHYSTSPPDWCKPGSSSMPVLYNLVPDDEDLMAIMRLADPRLLLYERTLPLMVNRILTEGASVIMAEAT